MRLKRILASIFLLAFLTGCQKILFENPMPIWGTSIMECPKEFDGSYLSLYYTDHSVSAQIHRVDRMSDFEIIVYDKRCEFIDSLYLEKRKLPPIDTAWFEHNSIYVKAGQLVQAFELNDTLSSEEDRVGLSLDFNKMLYSGFMEDTSFFKMKLLNDNYYLNIEKVPDFYSIGQLKFIGKNIKIKTLDFGISDSINPTSEFIEKYKLIPKKEVRGKFYIQNYLANLKNEEFAELTENEDVFQSHIWYKIESSNNNYYYYWIIVIIIALITIILIRKRKDNMVYDGKCWQ